MKRTFALGFLIVCTLLLANTPPAPTGSTVGRFQLVAGTSPTLPTGGIATMFRIDTMTGQTWQLQAVPIAAGNGMTSYFPVWNDCEELNGNLYKQAIAPLQSPK